MTSKRLRAVLFTKENCGPCTKTKEFIYDLLEHNLTLVETLSILKVENHSALREAYELNLFPTLLIVENADSPPLEKIVGGAAIRDCIEEKLVHIYRENNA